MERPRGTLQGGHYIVSCSGSRRIAVLGCPMVAAEVSPSTLVIGDFRDGWLSAFRSTK